MICFVGGYAGSGTRVIQMLLEKAGVWVGKPLSASYDCHWTLSDFSDLAVSGIIHRCPVNEQHFRDHVRLFAEEHPDWSLKNGESMWAIPFIQRLFPASYYILVVRNGLDNILNTLPFSEMHARKFVHYEELYTSHNFNPWYHRMIFWNAIHRKAVQDGNQMRLRQFLIVRLEDLIEQPAQQGKRICDHLHLDFKEEWTEFIQPQPSIGKHIKAWEDERFGYVYLPHLHLERLKELGQEMLTKFHYL